eukprot:IDg3872t1
MEAVFDKLISNMPSNFMRYYAFEFYEGKVRMQQLVTDNPGDSVEVMLCENVVATRNAMIREMFGVTTMKRRKRRAFTSQSQIASIARLVNQPHIRRSECLLDAGDNFESIGAHLWARAYVKMIDWANDHRRAVCELDSYKEKFDKLVITKNTTGDPTFPPQIRRAKFVTREIKNPFVARTSRNYSMDGGDSLGSEDRSTLDHYPGSRVRKHACVVWERANKRRSPAVGHHTAQIGEN